MATTALETGTATQDGTPGDGPSSEQQSRPADFDGEVATSNELPSVEMLRKVDEHVVLDAEGRSHTFRSVYGGGGKVGRRVLVIFVRHFFCGSCQEYLKSLSESITPEALLHLPISTSVAVIGCGNLALIGMYVEATQCPFPIYTDPTGSLFGELGMVKTLAMGSRPEYIRKSLLWSIVGSIGQALKKVPAGMALQSGDHRQVGGEFLFEPVDVAAAPPSAATISSSGQGHGEGDRADGSGEMKRVTWCHRMKTTRDHAEIPELMEVLGLDVGRVPASVGERGRERWEKAGQVRKGSGRSLAEKMKQMKQANGAESAAEN